MKVNKLSLCGLIFLSWIAYLSLASAQATLPLPSDSDQEGHILTSWTDGFLDIYHLQATDSNLVFARLPDGTTLHMGTKESNQTPLLLRGIEGEPDYRVSTDGMIIKATGDSEAFRVGVNDQITLINQPLKYPEFDIRHIAAGREVWDGVARSDSVIPFHEVSDRTPSIRISYGAFDYLYGSADIKGDERPVRRAMEAFVGLVTGPVEVLEVNHSSSFYHTGAAFLKATRPRHLIAQTWMPSQLDGRGVKLMLSPDLYPGRRQLFVTNLLEPIKATLGARLSAELASYQGDVLIRVHPGGKQYYIYVLSGHSATPHIKKAHGPFLAR